MYLHNLHKVLSMKFDAVIYLITETDGQDEIGNYVPVLTKRKAYANKFSVSRAEFSAAGERGLKPDLSFQINTVDYASEELVEYLNQEYDVYRTQEKGDRTTLYLTRRVSNG